LNNFPSAGQGIYFHIYNGGTYNPADYGPFGTMRYREANRIYGPLTTIPGSAMGAAPIIQQGGDYFLPPSPDLTFSNSAWSNVDITRPNTGWQKLSPVNGGIVAGSPDFSSSGTPIKFGFLRSNSSSMGNNTCGRVANWNVTATSI